MKKIAVPVHNGFVNEHFGHSNRYSVFTITTENSIIGKEDIHVDQGCGCRSGIAEILANRGVTMMLAGNIGAGAIQHLYESGIDVVRGCSGSAESVIHAFLEGKVEDNEQICHQHMGCHDHDHSKS